MSKKRKRRSNVLSLPAAKNPSVRRLVISYNVTTDNIALTSDFPNEEIVKLFQFVLMKCVDPRLHIKLENKDAVVAPKIWFPGERN